MFAHCDDEQESREKTQLESLIGESTSAGNLLRNICSRAW